MRAALAYKRYNVGIRWGARSITCVAFLRLEMGKFRTFLLLVGKLFLLLLYVV